MTCRSARKAISEYIDGLLAARKTAALMRHLESCPSCRQIAADFKALLDTASRLDQPEPSEGVWPRIRAGLEGSVTDVAVPAKREPRGRIFGLGIPVVRYAGAALLGLILVASGVFFGIRLKRPGPEPSFRERMEYSLAKLDEAEGYYLKAIDSLNEAFAAQQGILMPEVAEMFARNLQVIDASIQACRRAVTAEPEDLEARGFLLASYMEKVSFLNAALEYPQRAPAVVGSGRGL